MEIEEDKPNLDIDAVLASFEAAENVSTKRENSITKLQTFSFSFRRFFK